MVDALHRAHRLVEPSGWVIDVHPTASDAAVEVGAIHTGRVVAGDAPVRHAAAARALETVVAAGLFEIERTHHFSFYTYGDSVEVGMRAFTSPFRIIWIPMLVATVTLAAPMFTRVAAAAAGMERMVTIHD